MTPIESSTLLGSSSDDSVSLVSLVARQYLNAEISRNRRLNSLSIEGQSMKASSSKSYDFLREVGGWFAASNPRLPTLIDLAQSKERHNSRLRSRIKCNTTSPVPATQPLQTTRNLSPHRLELSATFVGDMSMQTRHLVARSTKHKDCS
jgi:hypothetical protein